MVDRNLKEGSHALLSPQRFFVHEPGGSRYKDVGARDLAFGVR